MRNPRVASRYAKALVSLSVERNELDAVKADVEVVLSILKENREFRAFLASPIIKPLQKQAVIKASFKEGLKELTVNFLNLLVTHHRERFTKEVLESFIKQYLEVKGIVKAIVSTASPLDASLKMEFENLVKASTGKNVLLEENVNPDLIGGFIVRVGDKEFDSSIAGRLKKLKREFEENPYVSAI